MPAGSEGSLYLGLISGTSRDGADAALVHLDETRSELLHAICVPYPAALRADVDAVIEANQRPERGKAAFLDEQLGRFFARTANELIEQAGMERRDVRAIGSHGQTVWHDPDADRPLSIQLGSGPVISRTTGITTVTDFRRADLRAGGQGAPLAPLLHRALLSSAEEHRAVVNIGGIANVTLLDTLGGVTGFDTGPGNCLMDAWTRMHLDQPFDRDGTWAAGGQVIASVLERMLDDDYFSRPAPKSTGLERYNLKWLFRHLDGLDTRTEDVQATLAELTAVTIARALQGTDAKRVLLCGGGVHNRFLVSLLASKLEGMIVESTLASGLDPDWVEALLFAWLARERLAEREIDTGPITGARRPVLLGKVFEPPRAGL